MGALHALLSRLLNVSASFAPSLSHFANAIDSSTDDAGPSSEVETCTPPIDPASIAHDMVDSEQEEHTLSPSLSTSQMSHSHTDRRPHKKATAAVMGTATSTKLYPVGVRMPSFSNSLAAADTSATQDMNNMGINIYHCRVFDIPEIVRCIGEFLDKPTLAAACRISHLWRDHCTPLLWRHIEDKNWSHSNFCSAIGNNAIHVRSMRCKHRTDYGDIASYDFPRLMSLSFQGSKEGFAAKDKILQRVSNTLTTLILSAVGTTLTPGNVRTICGIKNLEKLKISVTALFHSRLATILDQCHQLEFLSLSHVEFDPTFNNVELELDSLDDVIDISEREMERSYETIVRQPTKIKYLALKKASLSCHFLSELTRLCPNLLELSLARNEELYMTGALIQSMARTCPNLYALDISSCKLLDRETFLTLFQSLPNLTIINLSGTLIANEELLLLANSCRRLSRLDIQYCTAITSKGLHSYLSQCSSTLRHLEASGVLLDPSSFDENNWKCSNIETLFLHVGLFGSARKTMAPLVASDTASNAGEGTSSSKCSSTNTLSEKEVRETFMAMDIDPPAPDTTLLGRIGGAKDALLSILTPNDLKHEETRREVDLVHKNDWEEERYSGMSDAREQKIPDLERHHSAPPLFQFSPSSFSSSSSSSSSSSLLSSSLLSSSSISFRSFSSSSHLTSSYQPTPPVVIKQNPLHPIQDLKNVQYLGLMGYGPKLTRNKTDGKPPFGSSTLMQLREPTHMRLLQGFRSVKRLNLLELNQTFQLGDLEWLIESLPELCRIDAERYNISDEVMAEFHEQPWATGVKIYRNE